MKILSPIPGSAMPEAAQLWWAHFGLLPRVQPQRMRAAQGVAALDGAGRVLGVMGLRDAAGGFMAERGAGALLWIYRPAPPTADLVIDGIAVGVPRQGTGRALVEGARAEARRRGRSGLRAEVRLGNPGALAFWQSLGFTEVTRGRYGWPWSGRVVVMRLAVEGA